MPLVVRLRTHRAQVHEATGQTSEDADQAQGEAEGMLQLDTPAMIMPTIDPRRPDDKVGRACERGKADKIIIVGLHLAGLRYSRAIARVFLCGLH